MEDMEMLNAGLSLPTYAREDFALVKRRFSFIWVDAACEYLMGIRFVFI